MVLPKKEFEELKKLGFTEDASLYSHEHAFKWFREKHGLYYSVHPEFYMDGINFNWQILWYLPRDKWTIHNVSDGTYMYGDNHEYPTQEDADLGAIIKMIEILRDGYGSYSTRQDPV